MSSAPASVAATAALLLLMKSLSATGVWSTTSSSGIHGHFDYGLRTGRPSNGLMVFRPRPGELREEGICRCGPAIRRRPLTSADPYQWAHPTQKGDTQC